MSTILAVDPGVCGCGVALFYGALRAAAYVKNPVAEGGGPAVCASMARAVCAWWVKQLEPLWVDDPVGLVLEWPTHYSGRAARGSGEDLLSLAAVDGAIAALFPGAIVRHVTPHEWKGSIPKPKKQSEPYIIRERVLDRLTEVERSAITWPGNQKLGWDVADAIGVALHALGRFERKRGNL